MGFVSIILLLFIATVIIVSLLTLPLFGVSYDFDTMPTCSFADLKAGDLILVRNDPVIGTFGYFSHVMMCIEIDGKVYTTEAYPSKLLEYNGCLSEFPLQFPEYLKTRFPAKGAMCVRRLKTPLNDTQKEALKNNVLTIKAKRSVYDTLLVWTYLMSITPLAFLYQNDNRYYCSEYVVDLLDKSDICTIEHPLLKMPGNFGSKAESGLDILNLTNLSSATDALWSEEEIPQ